MSQTRQPIQVFPKITLKLGIWGRVALVLAIITAIASYILYHNGVRYKNREKSHYQELTMQVQALQRAQQKSSDEAAALQRQVGELQTQLTRLTVGLQPGEHRRWLLAQVGRYVQLADQQLLLLGDIPAAQLLLDVADRLLVENPADGLLPLRQALAEDKLALTTARQVDKAGLSLRLDALKQQTNRVAAPPRLAAPQPVMNASASGTVWDRGWQAFRQLITVHHYDQPIRPLLGADQRWLLQQQLYLALSQAQLALWSGQHDRYRVSLREAEQLLTDYPQLNAPYTAILAEIRALQQVGLDAPAPTLSHSQQALAGLLAAERDPVAPQ